MLHGRIFPAARLARGDSIGARLRISRAGEILRNQRWWLSIAAYLAGTAALHAASPQVVIPPGHAGEFIGAAGCKSSSCHGGAGEKRSQYITWTQQDFHARAYAVLVNARSARMAESLRLGQAQTSARCTICHSPFQAVGSSRLTSAARVDEGVSCESCHNAAGSWLRGHTRTDWTYAMRVTAGMRDLRKLYVRANSCVACHQNIDTDILNAGHPELRFELDGQSVAEPKHWRDPPGTGAKAWIVGQAVALREMSWALGNLDNASTDEFAKWNGLVWVLFKATQQQTAVPLMNPPPEISAKASYIDMQGRADSLARAATEASVDDDFARIALQVLSTADAEFRQSKASNNVLFSRAERLVPAVYRLAVTTGSDSDTAPSPQLRALIEAVRTRGSFDPLRFAEALANYRTALAAR